MKKTKLSLLLGTLLCASIASADALKVEVGVGSWNASPSGNLKYQGTSTDLENGFGFEKENLPYFYADIEHPIPVVPNFRLEYTDLAYSGSSSQSISFGGQTFNTGINTTDISFKTIDAILYYNVWETFNLNVDLGLDFKYIEGEASVKNNTLSESTDFKIVIPHLYTNVRYDFPLDIGLEANGKYFTYDGATSYDASIKVDYTFYAGLKLEAGYRASKLEVSESFADEYDVDTVFNMDFSGPFIGLAYKF